jgi:hypothetical protein
VPAFTVITPGVKAKLSIFTSGVEPVDDSGVTAGPDTPPASEADNAGALISAISDTITTNAHTQTRSTHGRVLFLGISSSYE